jgi:hypothetical protein
VNTRDSLMNETQSSGIFARQSKNSREEEYRGEFIETTSLVIMKLFIVHVQYVLRECSRGRK